MWRANLGACVFHVYKDQIVNNNHYDILRCNPFPNKPWFLQVCSTSLLKTQWEKEKLLITSNFSFSHSVFYPFGELSGIFIKFEIVVWKLFQFGSVWNLSFGKGLITESIVAKEKNAIYKQFIFFFKHNIYYMAASRWKIVVCKWCWVYLWTVLS